MPASNWEAPVPVLLHCSEPCRSLTCQGESKLAKYASRCSCANRKINQGNKRNLAESNADRVGKLQKKQRNVGHFEAMQYFMQDAIKRLTWLAPLFNNGKVDSYGSKNAKISCHLVKELWNTKLQVFWRHVFFLAIRVS